MTWLQTTSGRAFDLLRPDWQMVDLEVDIAEALARLARFTGHVPSGPYSVAQHCVIGADCVFRDTSDREAAAAFLLHDAHEAYLGDIATPVMRAIAQACATEVAEFEIGPSHFRRAIRRLKQRIDSAIEQAIDQPGLLSLHAELIHGYDLRMLATERRHLLVPAPQPWSPIVEAAQPLRLASALTVWAWPKAADEFRDRLRRYLPERFGAPSPRPKPAPRKTARRIPLEA